MHFGKTGTMECGVRTVLGFAARMCTDDIVPQYDVVGYGCLHRSPRKTYSMQMNARLFLELGRELEVENSRLHELASRLQ